MRTLSPMVAALLLACKEGGGTLAPVVYDLEGTWTFEETVTDSPNDITCEGQGTLSLTQTGTAFSGTVTETGTCTVGSEVTDISGSFPVTGTVTGLVMTMTDNGVEIPCTFNGTLSGSIRGSPPTRLAGAERCTGTVQGVTYDLRGTWEATR